jgi:hypothetical protein
MPSSSKVLKLAQTAPKCHELLQTMGAGVPMNDDVVPLKMERALGV